MEGLQLKILGSFDISLVFELLRNTKMETFGSVNHYTQRGC